MTVPMLPFASFRARNLEFTFIEYTYIVHLKLMPSRINFINYPYCHPVDHSNTHTHTNKHKQADLTKAKAAITIRGREIESSAVVAHMPHNFANAKRCFESRRVLCMSLQATTTSCTGQWRKGECVGEREEKSERGRERGRAWERECGAGSSRNRKFYTYSAL